MRPRHLTRPRLRSDDRRGFTLLEVILALGLSLVLMAAVLSAIGLYRQLSSAGRQQVEQAQLARALFKMIEADIRACTYRAPEPAVQEEEEELATGEQTLVETIDTAASLTTDLGLVGDPQTLVLHVSRPANRLETIAQQSALAQQAATSAGVTGSDAKSIAYFLAVSGGGGLQGAAAEQFVVDDSGAAIGLMRLSGDRLTLQQADTTGDLQTLAAHSQLLAGEVDVLSFSYFDGTTWYDTWDSSMSQRLPNAVEVLIGFRAQVAADAVAPSELTTLPPSTLYRFVVSLSTAVSAAATTSLTSF